MAANENRKALIEEVMRALRQVGRSGGRFAPGPWMDLNLTIGQLKSLFFIDFKGCTNLKSLAEALGVTPPNVTGIIDRMVEQGLVTRGENPENRRMLVVQATEKGKRLVSRLREVHAGTLKDALSKLSEMELEQLANGLSALARVTLEE